MDRQEFKIASKAENISLVEKLIEEVCENYQVNDDYYGNILVALTEAVNNAIQHGNKSNPEKTIYIAFNPKPDGISFIVKDQGEGFNFDSLPDPTSPENIEKPSGRGVFLMRNLADKVEFQDEGRTVCLDFNVSAN